MKWGVCFLMLLGLTGCTWGNGKVNIEEEVVSDQNIANLIQEGSEEVVLSPGAITYDWVAELNDVRGGNGEGTALATVKLERYHLLARLVNLPELDENYFYEGWLVRDNPENVLSTGRFELMDGVWTNTFSSKENLLDHTRFVVTLEPEDGDPGPAEHVAEGEFESRS